MKGLVLSNLGHTWLLDLDGTVVKHNGYKFDGIDSFLEGAIEFLNSISQDDKIIFLTSRRVEYREATIDFLKENNIRYDHIIFDLPYGERILVNDDKPSGLHMSIAVNNQRDNFELEYLINDNL